MITLGNGKRSDEPIRPLGQRAASFASKPIVAAPLALLLLAGTAFSVGALFLALPWAGGAVIGICVWVALLNLQITKHGGDGTLAATVLLGAAAVAAVLSGALVVTLDWVSLRMAGAAVTALYASALVFGVLKALSWLWRVLAGLGAVAMTIAVLVIPPEAPAAADEAQEWKVSVRVVDPDANPIEGALAHCVAGAIWDRESPLSLGKDVKRTDADGRTRSWTFNEVTPAKAGVCAAAKEGEENGPDYPIQTVAIAAVFSGGEFEAEIVLRPADQAP